MNLPSRSRRIPNDVVSKLIEDSRDRCCICRVIIDPKRFDREVLFSSLEKHHIVYLSEKGGNTYDNLLIVCANCHRQIHRHRDRYPSDKFQDHKIHWINMKQVVPSNGKIPLRINDSCCSLTMSSGSKRQLGWFCGVIFSIESINLQYTIWVPIDADITVAQLALFVRDKILKPLGEYDKNSNWLRAERVALALRSAPEYPLDPNLSIEEIKIGSDDAIVAIVSVQTMPVAPPQKRRRTTTKSDLINAVAMIGLTKKVATQAVEAIFTAIKEALVNGDKVQVIGFGSFSVKKRKARCIRNPHTGEIIHIPARNVPIFRPGHALKETVR